VFNVANAGVSSHIPRPLGNVDIDHFDPTTPNAMASHASGLTILRTAGNRFAMPKR